MFEKGLNLLLSVEHTKVEAYFKQLYDSQNDSKDPTLTSTELNLYMCQLMQEVFNIKYTYYYLLSTPYKAVYDYFFPILYYGILKKKEVILLPSLKFDVHPVVMRRFLTFIQEVASKEDKKLVLHTHNLAVIDWFDDQREHVFIMTKETTEPTTIEKLHDTDWLDQCRLSSLYKLTLLTNYQFTE